MKKGFSLIELMIVVAIIAILMAVILPMMGISQGARMQSEITNQTLNGTNAIQNYEWFKTQYESIQSQHRMEKQSLESIGNYVEMMPVDKTKWTQADRDEWSRLRMICDGLKYQTSDMIAEYNGRCKMVNRSLFKNNLPTNIIRGAKTGIEFKWNNNEGVVE